VQVCEAAARIARSLHRRAGMWGRVHAPDPCVVVQAFEGGSALVPLVSRARARRAPSRRAPARAELYAECSA